MKGLRELIHETHRRSRWHLRGIFRASALSVLLLLPEGVTAQSEAEQRQWMYEQYGQLPQHVRGGSVEPHWIGEDGRFWFIEDQTDRTTVQLVDPDRRTRRTLFDVEPLREELRRVLGGDLPGSDEQYLPARCGDRRSAREV